MSITLELSTFLAGSLTLLSPCVLPIIPFVATASLKEHKLGPFFLGLGLVLSFSATTFLIARSGSILGLEAHQLRYFAGGILFISSFFFIFTKLFDKLSGFVSPVLQKISDLKSNKPEENPSKSVSKSLLNEFINGVFLGPIWAPCSGPTLGVVMGLLATQDSHYKAFILLIYFAAGSLIPLIIISYGAQKLVQKIKTMGLKNAKVIKISMGLLSLAMSVLILTGLDKKLEAFILSITPEFLINLSTSI